MLKTDLVHCEQLLSFFNFELLVGGEYPFYTDDRILAECGTLEKKVYRNGKRTTVKIPPISIYTSEGAAITEVVSNKVFNSKNERYKAEQSSNQFISFVVNKWEMSLTNQQKQFVNNVLAGNEQLYTKQQRYQFRRNIQKRLKIAFIGAGGGEVSTYRIDEFRTKIDFIKRFIDLSDNNDLFSQEIIKNPDRGYITEIVYDKLSTEARKNIIACYQGKVPNIEAIHLYAFYDVILADMENFEAMCLS